MKLPSLMSILTGANAAVNLLSKLHGFIKNRRKNPPSDDPKGKEEEGDSNMGVINGITGVVSDRGGPIQGKKLEKKEIAEMRRRQVEDSLVSIGTQRTLMGQNVERILMQARRKGVTPSAKRTLYVKWRIAQQQYDYLNTMHENLELILARMQISDMTVEFGEAISAATAVIRENNKETPDFSALMRKFNKQIAPVNELMGEGFESMTKSLLDVEMPTDGLYSESSFDAAIRGETAPAEVASDLPFPPAESAQEKTPDTARQEEDLEDTLRRLARDLEGK